MRGLHRLCMLALVAMTRIAAQTTSSVVCTTDLWTINHENQTPCRVAAALEGACFNGVWNIAPLQPGQKYSGPVGNQSSKCQCNTVAFSLVAACGACQGSSGISTWPEWITNCSQTDITVGGYPLQIPVGTDVPAWAYLDVTKGNVWDAAAALAVANSNPAERTGGSPPATGIPTGGASPTNSVPSQTSSSKSSSSKAGPIAGGVVAGVVGLALFGFLGFFFYRRRYSRRRSNVYANEKVDLVGAPTPVSAYGGGGLQSPTLPMQQEPPRLYDPSDPSTFPTTPPPPQLSPAPGYTTPTSSQPYVAHHISPPPGIGGGYSGAPEV